ncbi:MAG TPA: DUF4910 domain-containing protein [Chryseosolibacter sp.]
MKSATTLSQPELRQVPAREGEAMHELMRNLYPICRSITGAGTVETLKRLQKIIPLSILTIPTGTKVFDWEIPKEWNIRAAWIRNSRGETIVDFKNSNLHVVNYSAPVKAMVSLDELRKHVHTLPEHPDWVPYRTSYYHEDWGFCMSHNQLKSLEDDTYEVWIDSSLEAGHLSYGELVLKGKSQEEVLISTHICHPSLCNDNLSGISVAAHLALHLQNQKRKYTYRFLFIPGTIGAITWLAVNELHVRRIKHGLIAALLGLDGAFTYKKSRIGDAEIDQVAEYVLTKDNRANKIKNFEPYGYDERQFCSPGFNLPVGCLTRTPYGEYPEYHTSADNLDLVDPHTLAESLRTFIHILELVEQNRYYLNLRPKCEPQLGRYGLYSSLGGENNVKEYQLALLWALNLSDGKHSLLDIAQSSSLDFSTIATAAAKLHHAGLLRELSAPEHAIERV